MKRRAPAVAAVLVGLCVAGLAAPHGASAGVAEIVQMSDHPTFLGWTSALPPAMAPYNPTSADDCTAGRIQCVDQTLRAMTRHFDRLADVCDHNAVFALSYLRTTEAYRQAVTEPEFFDDPAFVNHEDVVFAEYYTRAYEDWRDGRRGDVAPAWRIAFDNAAARRVSGSGNLLLGINAHVNRDLAFVLASIGLRAPDGASRKPDHDQVNVFLNRVSRPMLAEAADRFDPAMDDSATPYDVSYTGLMQLLQVWREGAWRNAERLVNAPDAAALAKVARQIEDAAVVQARAIVAATAYVPGLTDSTARDRHCARHGG